MAKLDAITKRLDQALGRIEGAIEGRLDAPREGGDGAADDAEVQALKAQCDRLRDELESIRAEYASLKQLTDTVSGRLDKAIDELQTVLEG